MKESEADLLSCELAPGRALELQRGLHRYGSFPRREGTRTEREDTRRGDSPRLRKGISLRCGDFQVYVGISQHVAKCC